MNTSQIRPVINKNGLGYRTYVLVRDSFFTGKKYRLITWIRSKETKRIDVTECVSFRHADFPVVTEKFDDITVSATIEEAVSNIRKVYGTSDDIEEWQP
ncbi:hypothetical protein [Alteromonas mediterranea]|uniref:Uncharacterized protein n=1 Tax=Alteromonas mediterranea (strain DSM 17117 / CIP 110805 / LMG 28347 / Deep ecotype) TaxID=1774373 RepID=F2GCB9_ALTMD|nr:hypothetical protein [Alteromonas mediterranea]AEA99075.1 hypothetical protein MADE_1014705 [Alteromonas mediterranea DE]